MTEHRHNLKKFNHDAIDAIIPLLDVSTAEAELLSEIRYDLRILHKLLADEQYEPAIKYLAYGLPKREAIWWGFICSEEAEKDLSDELVPRALSTVQEWVKTPSEELRRTAGAIAKDLENYTPISWIATAIFWSGGSIAKVGAPEIDPQPYMYAKAISNGLLIAADQLGNNPATLQKFINRGLHIAMGGNGRIAA
jgi:hypothetical protein